MTVDRAARVAETIINLIFATAGREEASLRRRIEELLRDEFSDERRQGVADRGDDCL
jgi:hypothetical protein